MNEKARESFAQLHKEIELLQAMRILFEDCSAHPTCEKCDFWQVHKGCSFRNKTPREWFG